MLLSYYQPSHLKALKYTIKMSSDQLCFFNFNASQLRVFGTFEKPMFLAKEVGEILGIKNYRDFVSTLDEDEKGGVEVLDAASHRQKMTLISESALYRFIMRSNKPDAVIFQKWVCKDVLPSIRNKGLYLSKEKEAELLRLLEECKEKERRLYEVNKELLSFKKSREQNEYVYIISNRYYAEQGIYKIGRTKNMKNRLSNHNTSHVHGDKLKVLAEFKVGNSVQVEQWIHRKLKSLLVPNEKEYFLCPYNLLYDLVNLVVNHDHDQSELVNSIIDTVYHLKQNNFSSMDWTNGLDMDVFKDEIRLISDGKELVKFDVSTATKEQLDLFISGCIDSYNKTISEPEQIAGQIAWKLLQGFMIKELCIPKYKFKATEWKNSVKNYVEENRLSIKWK